MPRDDFDQQVIDADATQQAIKKLIRAAFPQGASEEARNDISWFIDRIIMHSLATAFTGGNVGPGTRRWKEGWEYTAKNFMRQTMIIALIRNTAANQRKNHGANATIQEHLTALAKTTTLVTCLLQANIPLRKFF